MCIVDVKINEDEIHHIHLVKEQKWEIKQDIISAKKCTMEYCQSIQKIRSKTALKDDVIQQGIDACLAEDFPESITKYGNAKNISKEDFAQLKLQSECLYDKGWSDELLIRCMMAQEFQGNLKEPVFVVWMQPKEGYDESLKKVVDWVYGNDGGLYFLVWYSSNTKEWNSHMISQITPPAFSVRDAQN